LISYVFILTGETQNAFKPYDNIGCVMLFCSFDTAGKARICGKPAQNHPRDGAHRRLNTRYLIQDLIQGRLNIYAFRRPYLYFMVS